MKTIIVLNNQDVVDVLRAHATHLVRMDFEPKDVKLSVKPWGSKEWSRGEVVLSIEVEGTSEDYID
jgi:hypothetical protein